jgi:hypothetical protein
MTDSTRGSLRGLDGLAGPSGHRELGSRVPRVEGDLAAGLELEPLTVVRLGPTDSLDPVGDRGSTDADYLGKRSLGAFGGPGEPVPEKSRALRDDHDVTVITIAASCQERKYPYAPDGKNGRMGEKELLPEEAMRVRRALKLLYEGPSFNKNKARLGRAIGRTPQAVALLLDGINSPRRRTAERIAELCRISLEDLLGTPLPVLEAHTLPSLTKPPKRTK